VLSVTSSPPSANDESFIRNVVEEFRRASRLEIAIKIPSCAKVHMLSTPHRRSPFLFLHLDLGARPASLRPLYSPSEIIGSATKIGELFRAVDARIYFGRPGGATAAIFNPALALQHRLHISTNQKVGHCPIPQLGHRILRQ
jgi:hypothetical protein